MRSVFWYDEPLHQNKPIAPHLITMEPVGADNVGWLKVTGGCLEPLTIAMREACSHPRATYPEMETLLRRLAKTYGAEVHRKGGIAPAIQWEYSYVMKAKFLDMAGLPQDLNTKYPLRIAPTLSEEVFSDIASCCNLVPFCSLGALTIDYFRPSYLHGKDLSLKLPQGTKLQGRIPHEQDLRRKVFAQGFILYGGPADILDLDTKEKQLEDVFHHHNLKSDYKFQILNYRRRIRPVYYEQHVLLWWKAHLNEDGLLVSHVQGKTQ